MLLLRPRNEGRATSSKRLGRGASAANPRSPMVNGSAEGPRSGSQGGNGPEQRPDLGELLDGAEHVTGLAADLAPGEPRDGERRAGAGEQGGAGRIAEQQYCYQRRHEHGGTGA